MELLAMAGWGLFLGFLYHIVSGAVNKYGHLTYLLWPLAGIVFFVATAGFLFYLDRGDVGLYGFPFMVLGFFIYVVWLRKPVLKIFCPIFDKCRYIVKLPFKLLRFSILSLLLPIGWLAQEGGVFLGFLFKCLRKLIPFKKGGIHRKYFKGEDLGEGQF